jgi:hypothetical protein
MVFYLSSPSNGEYLTQMHHPDGHVHSNRTFFFSNRRTQGFFYSLSGNLHPQQSSEVSPFLSGDQLNLSISRVQDLKPPTLPFKTWDSHSGDTGTAPSTCNHGLGLTIGTSRYLTTSPPRQLNRRIFTLLVCESPRCEYSTGY